MLEEIFEDLKREEWKEMIATFRVDEEGMYFEYNSPRADAKAFLELKEGEAAHSSVAEVKISSNFQCELLEVATIRLSK